MFCGEEEFMESAAGIASQKGLAHYHHHVITGLPEAEAHNTLWSAWNDEKSNFDLFVKVDADTILRDENVIADVWQLFTSPRVTGAQFRLHDYFTDQLIAGLNFFTPIVTFNTSPELYCDRVDGNHDIVLKGATVAGSGLEPIGLHCKYPNDRQAFHFGLHRKLKGQTSTLKSVYEAYCHLGGRARSLALMGASVATKEPAVFQKANSYSSEPMKQWFAFAEAAASEYLDVMAHSYAESQGWK